MDEKNISQAVISRLPRYLRYLGELKDSNVERISSQELSELMHVTASQIRQDFNNFTGIFDCNEALYGKKIRDMYVQPMDNLESFVKENAIDIAVLTIPKTSAVKVAEQLVNCGVKAFWNFAHVDLNVSKDIVVENVHLSDSLMKLTYNITTKEQEDNE